MLPFYKKVIQLRQIYKSPSLLPKKKKKEKKVIQQKLNIYKFFINI